jgi:hypothetical protein
MHELQMNLLPSCSGQMVTTGSSSTMDKDGSSMFSQILAHLPQYTVSSSETVIFIFTGIRISKLITWTDVCLFHENRLNPAEDEPLN